MDAAFVYSQELLKYSFGRHHPLQPLRLQLLYELLHYSGLLEGVPIIPPRTATDDELQMVHEPDYVAAVRHLSTGATGRNAAYLKRRFGFDSPDNPVFPGMHDAAALIAGGAIEAADRIILGEVSRIFYPGGGLHHAMAAKAAGFCIYNDPALAISRFLANGWRVLYIDGDAHHGDGVEAIFIEEPRVLTISLHEDGRFLFPGTGAATDIGQGPGTGFAANVPLLPNTGDDAWIAAFDLLVPPLARAFKPDVIVTQHGCDAHNWDPLSHLSVSTRTFEHWAQVVEGLSQELCDGRWLALGGGGYDIWRVVPRAWSLVWSAVSRRQIPSRIPDAWLNQWQSQATVPLPAQYRDDDSLFARQGRDDSATIAEISLATARQTLHLCLPRVQAGS